LANPKLNEGGKPRQPWKGGQILKEKFICAWINLKDDPRKPTGPLADLEEKMQREVSRLQKPLPSTGGLRLELPIGAGRALLDHRWAMEHPLLHVNAFRTEMLVGDAQTFFGSSINGTPQQTIGNGRPAALPKK
jgi:hypothetical protein